MAIGEIISVEVARQRALPPMPQFDGTSVRPVAKLTGNSGARSLCISLEWITG